MARINEFVYKLGFNSLQKAMEVTKADNLTLHAVTYWTSAEYSDIDNSSVSTVEVLENNGSIFTLNGTDLLLSHVEVDLSTNCTEGVSGLSGDEATMELITMVATAFVLGLVILATVIGKSKELGQTRDFLFQLSYVIYNSRVWYVHSLVKHFPLMFTDT
jgi:hypothetical protein